MVIRDTIELVRKGSEEAIAIAESGGSVEAERAELVGEQRVVVRRVVE